MANKKFVGIYQSEFGLLDKVDELELQGYSESDMYVVTSDMESLSMVRGQTDVDLKSPEGSWLDRFMAVLSGDETVMAAFSNMGFTEEESTRYYNEVKKGGFLLFVDQEFNHEPVIVECEYVDANIGANLTVDYSNNTTPLYDPTNTNVDVDQDPKNLENGTSGVVDYREDIHIPSTDEQSEVTEIEGNEDALNESEEVSPESERERLLNKSLMDRDRLV